MPAGKYNRQLARTTDLKSDSEDTETILELTEGVAAVGVTHQKIFQALSPGKNAVS